MGRRRVDDFLQAHRFFLTDIVPTLQPPHFVFDPALGFSSITSPEVQLDVHEIVDGNASFKRKVVGKANVSTITLGRGVRFFDSDMWNWIEDAISGKKAPRRTLVLWHLHAVTTANEGAESSFSVGREANELGHAVGKAWVLFNVLPSRYKAGTDFDALDSSVSVAEIDIEVEGITEVNLAKGLINLGL